MIPLEDAEACLEAAAAELRELSYEELERFARSHGMLDDWQSREVQIDGEKVDVNTMIGKLGRIHKRISVELTLSAESGMLPADTPFLYFERYESGRLYPSPREAAMDAVLAKVFPYALFGLVTITLLGFAWFLFARAN